MARFVVGAVFGVMVGIVAGAALGLHAQSEPEEVETVQAGDDADSPPVASPVSRDWVDQVLDCLAWAESRNTPSAYNRSSGASGLLQFLPSTFRSTPQGRAGLSIWDPSAQRAAGRYMILAGRGREWSTWRLCA